MSNRDARTVVLDTSALVADPEAAKCYPGADIVLPLRVIEELDGLADRTDETGYQARHALRVLETIRAQGAGSLAEPVKLDNQTTVRVVVNGVAKDQLVTAGLDTSVSDNRIIGVAAGLNTAGTKVTVVSNDAAFRIKASQLGLDAIEHHPSPVVASNGWQIIEASSGEVDALHDSYLDAGDYGLVENEYAVLRCGSQSGFGRVRDGKLAKVPHKQEAWGAKGRNIGQRAALDLLLDDTVAIVAIDGPAGTGKTLLAIAAGLEQVVERGKYDRVSVFRSLVPVGREELGFLPGDLTAKTTPHFAAMYDAVCALTESRRVDDAEKLVDELVARRQLTMEPVSFLRGRTLARTIVVVDEAQNLERAVLKTLLTRVGEGTKVVFTGDTSQVDNPYTSQSNNALSALIDAFSGQRLFGHIRLTEYERSVVAGLAADLL